MKKSDIIVAVIVFALLITAGSFSLIRSRNGESPREQTFQTENQDSGEFASQTNSDGPVAVTITPKNLSDNEWSFEVVLDTHLEELTANLTEVVILLDEEGNENAPTTWEGDPPGGHHRSGILRFNAPTAQSKTIILKVLGV
ncbi:MAG: hypothetical protein Q8P71_00675, partial [bacterium]|nr:hypothetical protein [bacterium]